MAVSLVPRRLWSQSPKTGDLDTVLCKDDKFGEPNTMKRYRRDPLPVWYIDGERFILYFIKVVGLSGRGGG